MEKKGLTFTAVFLAQSANYGEGIGNVAALKKISRNRTLKGVEIKKLYSFQQKRL